MAALIGIAAHQAMVQEVDTMTRHHVVNSAYIKAVRKAGGVPVLLPLVEPGDVAAFLDAVDGVILTGGDDVDPAAYGQTAAPETGATDPLRDELEMALARAVVERDVPTLAICRGCQVLNVALGGTLHQHVDGHYELDRYNQTVHQVGVMGPGGLARWLPPPESGLIESGLIDVNTLHHQSVDRLGPAVRACAAAGDGTVEALEVEGAPAVLGVQWHPELLRHRPEHLALFGHLVELASARPGRTARTAGPST